MRFHAGGVSAGAKEVWGWLTINLTEVGDFGIDQYVAFQGFSSPLLGKWAVPKAIHLPIRNFGVPHFPAQFWKDLLQSLAEIGEQQEDGLDVLIVCEGGHGRTGLVLAILAGLIFDYQEPVNWVRKNYCHHAVETAAQATYVWEMLGVVNPHMIDRLFPPLKKKGTASYGKDKDAGKSTSNGTRLSGTTLSGEGSGN